jgi:hypothetical protein
MKSETILVPDVLEKEYSTSIIFSNKNVLYMTSENPAH